MEDREDLALHSVVSSSEHASATGDELGWRVRIDLAYLGTHFHGWQAQRELRTVQGELSRLLGRLLGRSATPVAAGRTDTGVHARGQVCHVAVRNEAEAGRLGRALALLVPEDIQILAVRSVSPAFDARFSALQRRYAYHLRYQRDIFRPATALLVDHILDRDAMDTAAEIFLGTHDFTSFCKTSSLREGSNACTVDLCHFQWEDDSAIFHVRANRFLHRMVRNLVGTLLEVGRERRAPADVAAILAARQRQRAGPTAPPHGLFLEEVSYPTELLEPAYRPAVTPAGPVPASESEGDSA